MTDPTEALARAHALREAFRQLKQGENVGYDLPRYLAALGYEVRPIEPAAEAADREAAGHDRPGRPPARQRVSSAAADPDEVRPIRNWSSFGMDSGFAGFYHQHIPECDPDCVLNVVRDSWKIEELPIHSVTAEAAAVLLRDTPEDREWLAFRLHEAFWHGEHEFEVGCADGKQDADRWRRKADAIIAGLRGEG